MVYTVEKKKPNMTAFFRPFVNSLQDLYRNGVDWLDEECNTLKNSIVVAPIASLDASARAAVHNIMQYNGECGCTFCEH